MCAHVLQSYLCVSTHCTLYMLEIYIVILLKAACKFKIKKQLFSACVELCN